MEIKKREIVFSVIIIAVMLIAGFFFSNAIHQNILEKYQEYDTAVQIDSEELFRHGMRTSVGNAFVYGNLKALDPVTYPEIEGEYSYIKKEEQEYREHSRTVTETYTDSEGNTKTRTKTEYYWTWDTMRTESKTSTKISFLNVEFEYDKIPFPSSQHIKTLSTGYHKRNIYYGTETEFQGTIFTNLKDNTINKTSFYRNQTISDTIDSLETGYQLVIFWVCWIMLTAALVVGFCYLDNKWLD